MIIRGKEIASEILDQVAGKVKKLPKPPRLAAVLVGDYLGSRKFLELKKSAAEKTAIDFRIYEFPNTIMTKELRRKVVEISKAQINSGIIIELPLPAHINTQYVLNAIPEEKDVDVLSQKAQGAFFTGRSPILPPAVEAVKIIFEKYNIVIKGKNCAVFGYGLLVGKPISHWLAANGATVSIINEFTPDPKLCSLNADIIISGVGRPNLITTDMVKTPTLWRQGSDQNVGDGAIVIDFGYENTDGKMIGDVDFDSVSQKTSLITPVPGGVGPIVIAAVLKNLIKLISK